MLTENIRDNNKLNNSSSWNFKFLRVIEVNLKVKKIYYLIVVMSLAAIEFI